MNQNLIETFNLCLCFVSMILFMISNNQYKEWSTKTSQTFSIIIGLSTLTYMSDPFFHIIGLISAVVSSTMAMYHMIEITNKKVEA